MESIIDYLDMLEDLLDSSKNVPFSNKVSIDKDRIFDILNEMRMNIPNEVRQAQRIIEDHDRIIGEAKSKANAMLSEAAERSQDLVDDHEIYRLAVEQAQDLMDEKKKEAKDMRLGALDYADEVLARTEHALRDAMTEIDKHYRMIEDDFLQTIDVLYSNRQELRGGKN